MRVTPPASPRIGCVKYLNARPLIDGWTGPVTYDHPAALCESLASAALDVALVSSFEYLRSPIYTIVDGISIASHGPVYSVYLAFDGDLKDVDAIELDPTSRTSVNLLRCILKLRGLDPEFVQERTGDQRTGRLLIGDGAIRFRRQHGTARHYLDLGAEWLRLTAQPFVYALWLIRPEVHNPESVAAKLRSVRDTNLRRLDEVALSQSEFDEDFCRFYWKACLHYQLGDREKAGLLKFRALCESFGILEQNTTALRLA